MMIGNPNSSTYPNSTSLPCESISKRTYETTYPKQIPYLDSLLNKTFNDLAVELKEKNLKIGAKLMVVVYE